MSTGLYNPAHDRKCIECGYNLRGLSYDSNCPECGYSIQDSVAADALIITNPRWFSRMIAGTFCLLLFVIIPIIVGDYGLLFDRSIDKPITFYIAITGLSLMIIKTLAGFFAVFLLTNISMRGQTEGIRRKIGILVRIMYAIVVFLDWAGSLVLRYFTSDITTLFAFFWTVDILSFTVLLVELWILIYATYRLKRVFTPVAITVITLLLIGATIELCGHELGFYVRRIANLNAPSYDFYAGQDLFNMFSLGGSHWTFIIPQILLTIGVAWSVVVFILEKNIWEAKCASLLLEKTKQTLP